MTWDTDVVRLLPGAGDNWPITWTDDDLQITALGDGPGFSRRKPRLSLGFARSAGDPPNLTAEDFASDVDTPEGGGSRGIKASGLLFVDGVLYLWVRNYKLPGSDDFTNARLAWSANRGTNWTWADWHFAESFACPEFIQFGRIPTKWMSRDGRTMWLLFSGLDGGYYTFCLRKATLSVAGPGDGGPNRTGSGRLEFAHHFVDRELPVSSRGVGDYGLTALVDIDRDGDLDFVLGGRPERLGQLYWFEYQAADRWVKHAVGTNYLSDVGLAALDVDADGWTDLVCSGVWFRNTGQPRTEAFQRFVFDPAAAGAHDVLTADVDGDGKRDVIVMGDERTQLKGLFWFNTAKDSAQRWDRHVIGPAVHGAITPGGTGDLDGDGDLDVVRADTWFENTDGRGREWTAHRNIPMGRAGPYGVCVRAAVLDIDGDRKLDIVMADADITDSKVVILRNADGQGGQWSKQELPQSFTYGSLHSLAVADMNNDGRPDIAVNEQEELLPPGRENPRWVIWENLGGGRFAERVVLDAKLGGHELVVGDVDGDGDVDICSKPWGPRAWNGNGGKTHVDYLENRLIRK